MITKELYDKGARCKGRGLNCRGCKDRGGCVECEIKLPFATRKCTNYNFELRAERYIDEDNSLIKEDLRAEFFDIEDLIYFIEHNQINFETETFYYGDYILKIDAEGILNDGMDYVRNYVKDYVSRVAEFERKKIVNVRGEHIWSKH